MQYLSLIRDESLLVMGSMLLCGNVFLDEVIVDLIAFIIQPPLFLFIHCWVQFELKGCDSDWCGNVDFSYHVSCFFFFF